MIADLEPYPAYRDSGVPWFEVVPAHWATSRLKAVFCEVDRRSGTGEEPLLSLRMQQGLVDHHAMGGKPIPPSNLVNYKLTQPGEIVMNRMRAAAGLFAATLTVGLVSPDYAVLRPKALADLQYFVYLFRTPLMMSIFRLESRGLGTGESGFLRLYIDRFGMLSVPVPRLEEQSAIVRFLDYVDRRIQRYIRAKQKLIKLLEEQKQAIIHRAVTRGLDPDVRLKPSGVEWLGEVPEHWEVVRSGSVFRLFGGFAFPGSGFLRGAIDSPLPIVLTPVNFEPSGGLRFAPTHTVRFSGEFPSQFVLKPGDLVTVLTDLSSKRLILGRAGLVTIGGLLLNQRTARIDLHKSVSNNITLEYLYYVLNTNAVRQQTIASSRGSTVFHTSPTRMLAARWALPPVSEQRNILKKLGKVEQAHLDTTARLSCEVALMHEYRTRLIADVVTGKLDVREAASRLPDEAKEAESFEGVEALAEGDTQSEDMGLAAAEGVGA